MAKGQPKGQTTMGMAASQARLLTITARIHDVEYQAQSIQNAKLQLATQSDEVYRNYVEALDATTMTLTTINPQSGEKATLAATFNNMFSRNRALSATGKEYVLKDRRNRVVVDEEMYNKYEDFKEEFGTDSPYMFALYMMDKSESIDEADLWSAEFAVIQNHEGSTDKNYQELTMLRSEIIELLQSDEEDPSAVYDTNYLYSYGTEEEQKEYEEKIKQYEKLLYKTYGSEIFENMSSITGMDESAEDFDKTQFDYYVNMYNVISQSNGCISIEDFNGPLNGDAKNDSDWLQSMVQSGLMTIETVNVDKKGEVTLNGTSPSSDENIAYTNTTNIDKKFLAKAEAKYEHDMKQIDKKDKQLDLTLSKLNSEREALKTQYDTMKTVIKENIQRTYNIFGQ